MSEHTIDIEGLPEGWEVKRIGIPTDRELYLANGVVVSFLAGVTVLVARIIVQKTTELSDIETKPRRIVLDQIPINEAKLGDYMRLSTEHALVLVGSMEHDERYTFWRIKDK